MATDLGVFTWPSYPAGSNPSVGPNGNPIPADSTLIGIDVGGVLEPVSSSNPVPIAPVAGSEFNVNLNEVGGAAIALGQALMSASFPVVIASNQSALPVTQSTTPWVDNISQWGGVATSLGQKVSASSVPVVIASDDTVAISAASLPLPTGASTSSLQTSGNTLLSTIISDLTNGSNIVVGLGTAGSPSGGVVSVQGVSGGTAIPVTDSNTSAFSGSVTPGTAGTASSLSGMVYESSVTTPTNGQQMALQADLFENLKTVLPDVFVTGQSAQTATINNILTTTAGTAATDVSNYKSASVQVTSTGTGGTFIFEGSNDNVNFQSVPVYSQLVLTGTPITAAITATASQLIYTLPLHFRYFRLRIATTITGGSIQAFTRYTQATWTPAVFQVAQATGGNLNATVGTVNVVSSVTSSNLAIPALIADVASGAITTTTTSATVTPTYGCSYSVNIAVTAATGTGETMDVLVQESADSGTNWYSVYEFPLITATGSYNSPLLQLTGNRIRYVQTIAGTTPSFTRAINRLQSSEPTVAYREIVDRTIVPSTTGSTTAVLATNGASNLTMVVNQGSGGSAVTFALDGSDDNTNWVQSIVQIVGVVGGSTPVSVNGPNMPYKFIRGRVVTGVASTTISYVSLIAQGMAILPTSITTQPSQGTVTDGSGTTSATPSTSTQIFAANALRKYLFIQNLSSSTPIWINFTTAAIANQPSIELIANAAFVMESSYVSTEAINVLSTGTSIAFTAKQG